MFRPNPVEVSDNAREFSRLRAEMVQRQLRRRSIRSRRMLEAMIAIRRHAFAPPSIRNAAYSGRLLAG